MLNAPAHLVGVTVDGDRVLHAGIVDEHIDIAEGGNELRNASKIGQVEADLVFPLLFEFTIERQCSSVSRSASSACLRLVMSSRTEMA